MNRRAFATRLAVVTAVAALPRVVLAQSESAAPLSMAADLANRAGELLFRAMSLIGTRYHRGGNSPETGFDCSGFVGYLYREVMNLRLPRSADEIWRIGQEVDRSTLEPGDLVFYNTMRKPFSHVGVYVGEGKFVHAPASGGAVRTENMDDRYWSRRWNGAKRIEP